VRHVVCGLNSIFDAQRVSILTLFLSPRISADNKFLYRYPPFDGETQDEIFESILDGTFDFEDPEWEEVSEEAKDLIKSLLTNENDRLTAKQALKHPWIKNNTKKMKSKSVSF
jgi:serine/threonine protein kinase